MLSDVALADALAENLDCGFEALALAWSDRLFAFALRTTGRHRDAEELAEEALVRAWQALADYSPERRRALKLRPWLFQIAANLARNRARSARRSPTVSLDVSAGGSDETLLAERLADSDPQAAPEAAMDAAQRQESLAALLLTLPEAQRIAVVLRHMEGMCYPDIAEVTGEPIGTVKSHVNRGVARLRRALERERVLEAQEVAG